MILFAAMCVPAAVFGQIEGEDERIQAGIGIIPGFGIQVGYIDQQRLYSRDAVFSAHVLPGVLENDGNYQFSGSIGAMLRIIGTLETIGAIRPRGFDIDVGARLGPGLTFGFEETRLERNQRFSLTLEPVARYAWILGGHRFYAEAGIVRPSIRAGILISL